MSRRLLAVLSSLVVVGLGCGAAPAADGESSKLAPKPRLLVAELYPLTVKGTNFKPRELVTVTLDGGKRGTKRVWTSRQGRFTVRFKVTIGRCATVTIRAVGSQRSRAVYQVPRPDCREP
jgi:hypothetical protein